MLELNLSIKRKNDTEASWPDLKTENTVSASCKRIAILEKGTVGGQPAIAFCVDTDNGTHAIFHLTANQLDTIAVALKGAKKHWESNPI